MKFFEDEAPRVTRSGADWEVHRRARQPHAGPAQDEIGVLAMAGFPLARSTDVVIALGGITAYSDGLLLHMVVLFADEQKRELLDWSLQEFSRSPGRFRMGVEMPNGSRATTGAGDSPPLEAPADNAVLMLLDNGVGPLRWHGDYWLWPLPGEGKLVLATRWPDRGIDETLVSVDTGPLRAAAAVSGPVWRAP